MPTRDEAKRYNGWANYETWNVLLDAALSEVDWYEIAENWWGDEEHDDDEDDDNG